MNAAIATSAPRALTRSLQALLLAGCLATGAGLGHSVANACSPTITASATNTVLKVQGTCFPVPSSVHLRTWDLTTGVLLVNWTTIPVTRNGQFGYITQQDARAGDRILFRVVDGAINETVTVTDI